MTRFGSISSETDVDLTQQSIFIPEFMGGWDSGLVANEVGSVTPAWPYAGRVLEMYITLKESSSSGLLEFRIDKTTTTTGNNAARVWTQAYPDTGYDQVSASSLRAFRNDANESGLTFDFAKGESWRMVLGPVVGTGAAGIMLSLLIEPL